MSSVEEAAKLEIRGATKIYEAKTGPVHALHDFSLDVTAGELVCILGPSGCGKTTLLWAMAGLHALTRGEILLDGSPDHRTATRGDRDDVPGREPPALAEPAQEHRASVRDQEATRRQRRASRRCSRRSG